MIIQELCESYVMSNGNWNDNIKQNKIDTKNKIAHYETKNKIEHHFTNPFSLYYSVCADGNVYPAETPGFRDLPPSLLQWNLPPRYSVRLECIHSGYFQDKIKCPTIPTNLGQKWNGDFNSAQTYHSVFRTFCSW